MKSLHQLHKFSQTPLKTSRCQSSKYLPNLLLYLRNHLEKPVPTVFLPRFLSVPNRNEYRALILCKVLLFCTSLVSVESFVTMTANVFGLCVRAGFGAQNCQPTLNLNRSKKLQVYTSPRLTQNPC